MKNNSSFFQNRDCEYFPCHPCSDPEKFNCLFCYCPLYMLGDKCGGDFVISEGNIKDCSACTRCHTPEAQQRISEMFIKIKETENKQRSE